MEKLQNAQVDRRKSEKEICGVFLQSRNRKSHENERKIVPKVIIPEPPAWSDYLYLVRTSSSKEEAEDITYDSTHGYRHDLQ